MAKWRRYSGNVVSAKLTRIVAPPAVGGKERDCFGSRSGRAHEDNRLAPAHLGSAFALDARTCRLQVSHGAEQTAPERIFSSAPINPPGSELSVGQSRCRRRDWLFACWKGQHVSSIDHVRGKHARIGKHRVGCRIC